MLRILGTAWLLALALPGAATAAATTPPTLLVLGDSLSAGYGLDRGQGWVALLDARLTRRVPPWRVVNGSISGDTTAGGLARLPALLRREHPAVVVVELGGKDALRGLSLDSTRANLLAMLRQARQAGARTVLVGMRIPPNYGPDYADRFAALFPAVARQGGATLVPFLLASVAEHRDWFQADDIHPAARAQPTMLDNVWPALQPLLRDAEKKR